MQRQIMNPTAYLGTGIGQNPSFSHQVMKNDENSVAETFGFPTLVENERPIQEVLSSVDLSKKL